MTDPDVKMVKVDNWGIYFLQRLKHFFNRTDYCDLTLQFQDNAQLKVHRLVLSACTEYFELLERTCEMYEDCLVMPDDLQADVVVPIVNFMYTGQLEFRMDLLERLYLTSQVMDMPVLTKLLEAHRNQASITPLKHNNIKRSYSKQRDHNMSALKHITPPISANNKRSFGTAFGSRKTAMSKTDKTDVVSNNGVPVTVHRSDISVPSQTARKAKLGEPRPTRYELPEELDSDNIFDNSFTNISYASQPLMVHPESVKHYPSKKSHIFGESSGSNKLPGASTVDIVECKKVSKPDNIFEDDHLDMDDTELFQVRDNPEPKSPKGYNQLFDQIIDQPNDGPKVTIETKDAKQAGNIDHAKIISEVLKKYPHLVKSNKNIKLKILNNPPTAQKSKPRKKPNFSHQPINENKDAKVKKEIADFTYETDVLDSKEAAKLIAMGADNINGPWICLICGTPGKALHFTSYYKFRRHLVEVHNEKPLANMCEYCGLKSPKRNYLLHHLYTKHGVEPPPSYNFPKCNLCNYIALTEGFLVKHKMSHNEMQNFRCIVCMTNFSTSRELMGHIRTTGHKYGTEPKRPSAQCIYCLKVFTRESNLFAHIKLVHKQSAKCDGILEDSDDEPAKPVVKYEPMVEYEDEYETQYQIRPDGNIEVVHKKTHPSPSAVPAKQKILNSGLSTSETKPVKKIKPPQSFVQDDFSEEVVMIDNTEYIMRENQLIPKKKNNEYMLSDLSSSEINQNLNPSTSMQYANIMSATSEESPQQKLTMKKAQNINQPIQIVVSNEEEYKALMNSNHSIIFDDGETNKTLTVLSAPHGTTLNAESLELDATQPGDMMIIQDNYPLTVSEALPTDNSNIVVVYGPTVSQENKQFQIITSQDIGAQFVQSSSVITQNIGSLTTTTPVMGPHVIQTQVEESWQDNIQNPETVPDLQAIQHIAPGQNITSIHNNVTDSVADLPEVTLTATTPQLVESGNVLQDNTIEIDANVNMDVDMRVENELEHTSITAIDVDESTESVVNTTEALINTTDAVINTTEAVINTTEAIINNNETIIDTTEAVINAMEDEQAPESEISPLVCMPQVESLTETEQIPINASEDYNTQDINEKVEDNANQNVIIAATENMENVDNDNIVDHEQEIILEKGEVPKVPPKASEIEVPKVAPPQIQSLTSEWSEDEYDIEEEGKNAQVVVKDGQNAMTVAESQDIEESIENIQQEVEKQIGPHPNNTEKSSSNVNLVTQPETSLILEEPKEKISSLLNDWEENDSQGNDSLNDTDVNNSTAVTGSIEQKEVVNSAVEQDVKKDDKIQSLVSDWDDDDDSKI